MWIEDGDSGVTQGDACSLSDDVLIGMLRQPPKEVPEMHSRDAFRNFFEGMDKKKMETLLRTSNAGKTPEEIEAKVAKRMKLLAGCLV